METLDILIRPYDEVTDLKRLSDIWFDASMTAHPFIGEARLVEQRQLIEEEYLPKAETWVACHEQEAVGFISLLGSFIGGLFTAPDRQGMGVGSKLISHALARHGELSLEVYTANEQAMRFYSSLGFREVSRRNLDDFGYPFPNAALHLRA
ncbi:GNAT family N-acetyltransferase [Cereibacter johrii]|uniref:GNAT family N-acetyltransferase n=1 Tax=Cereibacter johrii TaxID=445629 RepID=UPI003CF75840